MKRRKVNCGVLQYINYCLPEYPHEKKKKKSKGKRRGSQVGGCIHASPARGEKKM